MTTNQKEKFNSILKKYKTDVSKYINSKALKGDYYSDYYKSELKSLNKLKASYDLSKLNDDDIYPVVKPLYAIGETTAGDEKEQIKKDGSVSFIPKKEHNQRLRKEISALYSEIIQEEKKKQTAEKKPIAKMDGSSDKNFYKDLTQELIKEFKKMNTKGLNAIVEEDRVYGDWVWKKKNATAEQLAKKYISQLKEYGIETKQDFVESNSTNLTGEEKNFAEMIEELSGERPNAYGINITDDSTMLFDVEEEDEDDYARGGEITESKFVYTIGGL
jgi:hypothetical protein